MNKIKMKNYEWVKKGFSPWFCGAGFDSKGWFFVYNIVYNLNKQTHR